MDAMWRVASVLLCPQSLQQLSIFYLFWILLYMAVNIIWDIRSSQTADWHIADLTGKIGPLYNAASFASSFLLLVAAFDPKVRALAGDTVAPLILASLSGIFVSVGEVCPYKPNRNSKPVRRAGPRIS